MTKTVRYVQGMATRPRDNKPKPVTKDDRQTSTDYKNEPGWTDTIGHPKGRRTDTNAHGFSKTQRGQLNYVKSSAPGQSATSASSSSSSSSVRQPASNDARNFSSWKNESQPGYKRSSLGSLRITTKRKHIADDDVNISSHDEQSDTDDITVASTFNIIQPLPANVQPLTYNPHPLAYNERPRSLKDEDPIDNVDEYNARVPPQAVVYEELTHPPQRFDSNPTVYIKVR